MALQGNDVSKEKHTGFTYQGKEILLTKTRGRPVGGIEKREGWYPEEKRIEVATLYAVSGNKTLVEGLSGVPASTIGRWVHEEWFQSLLDAIRIENDQQIDAKQTQIIHDALEQIGDRVKNGDFVVTRTGDILRKPMSGKDLSIVEAINLDKRQLLRGKPTSRTEQVVTKTVEQKLLELSNTFRQLVNKPQIQSSETTPLNESDIIDVEIIDEGPNADETNNSGRSD